jgi:hypothetical protein
MLPRNNSRKGKDLFIRHSFKRFVNRDLFYHKTGNCSGQMGKMKDYVLQDL